MSFTTPQSGSSSPPVSPSDEVRALREEVAQLRHAVHAHATVDQAMGVVIALGQLSPQEAWDVLREVSMRTNTKLRLVAEQLVTWGRTTEMDPALRSELERQLALRRQEKGAASGSAASVEDVPLPSRCGGER
ncbi:ANTAR domain-containing protein [Streptomyces spectabilis]|uniref:ANTAR domain-containing protein n=1 Tax=Streptomyces spectabilis TaxID=68270 RepID=A0A516R1P2_STRST|nr:ANTAR domain-containing protein [Streptomyces spectabilis]QDQ09578.1 ANTAR domain-containing protein [Streptomyces spectabilis]